MLYALLLCTLPFLASFSWDDNFCCAFHIQLFALEYEPVCFRAGSVVLSNLHTQVYLYLYL